MESILVAYWYLTTELSGFYLRALYPIGYNFEEFEKVHHLFIFLMFCDENVHFNLN